ncbi:MAG TPA: DUF3306 domain-containing protein [Beijerinckiaceae bacterium]|nr:DUF3306 domain-containing protein [Beijerinckiaceae bacterium]
MSRNEGFLSRWSARKLAPPEPAAKPGEAAAEQPSKEEPAQTGEPFDPASLPSIDSLVADSDIRPFLRAGVPEALKTAALRRMWVSDPAIRDYIGPADFQWDFNTPGALAGFGELPQGTDIVRMLSDLGEGHRPESAQGDDGAAKLLQAPADAGDLPAPPAESATEVITGECPNSLPAPDEEAATKPVRRRRHGAATPV